MTGRNIIRTAIIGFGVAGRFFHAPFLAADPEFSVDAIVTGDARRAAAAAEEHPGVRILPDTEALWRDADSFDLVVVAAPSGLHAELARRALEAGLHVVVDKPFVVDPVEGDALIALAAERGRVLTVFQNRRWDGDFLTLRRLIAEGRLGEVRRFESRFEWWQPELRDSWKSTATVEEGGGILLDLGPHVVDQARVLFGPVREVVSEVRTRRDGAVSDDDAFLALEHESGVISHLWMSAVAPAPGPRFHVLGSVAGFTSWGLDGQEPALRAGSRPGDPGFGQTPPERWGSLAAGDSDEAVPMEAGRYGDFARGLAEAILRDAPPPVDPADAVAALRIIATARSAAEQ